MKLRTLALAALLSLGAPVAAQQPVITGPAGAYTIQTPGATKIERGDGWIKYTWVFEPTPDPGPIPNPTPPPIPDPTPPPAPVATGKLWVTYVWDASAETQEQATVRADLATAPEWQGLNVAFHAFERSQELLDRAKLRPHLAETPCVLIQEAKEGTKSAPIVKTLPKVQDKASVVDAVKTLRGTK